MSKGKLPKIIDLDKARRTAAQETPHNLTSSMADALGQESPPHRLMFWGVPGTQPGLVLGHLRKLHQVSRLWISDEFAPHHLEQARDLADAEAKHLAQISPVLRTKTGRAALYLHGHIDEVIAFLQDMQAHLVDIAAQEVIKDE